MFRKIKLKKQIRACIREIHLLEQRRSRSQAALISAILSFAHSRSGPSINRSGCHLRASAR